MGGQEVCGGRNHRMTEWETMGKKDPRKSSVDTKTDRQDKIFWKLKSKNPLLSEKNLSAGRGKLVRQAWKKRGLEKKIYPGRFQSQSKRCTGTLANCSRWRSSCENGEITGRREVQGCGCWGT